MIAGPAAGELALILADLVLLFGAAKLPELARGSGRALRIFKAETKGLMDDDDDEAAKPTTTPEQRELESRRAELDAESERQAAERPRGRRTAATTRPDADLSCRLSRGLRLSCAAGRPPRRPGRPDGALRPPA